MKWCKKWRKCFWTNIDNVKIQPSLRDRELIKKKSERNIKTIKNGVESEKQTTMKQTNFIRLLQSCFTFFPFDCADLVCQRRSIILFVLHSKRIIEMLFSVTLLKVLCQQRRYECGQTYCHIGDAWFSE